MKTALMLAGIALLTAGAVQAQETARDPGTDQNRGRLVLLSSYFDQFRLIDLQRLATASGVDEIGKTKQKRDAEEKARQNAPLMPVVREY